MESVSLEKREVVLDILLQIRVQAINEHNRTDYQNMLPVGWDLCVKSKNSRLIHSPKKNRQKRLAFSVPFLSIVIG